MPTMTSNLRKHFESKVLIFALIAFTSGCSETNENSENLFFSDQFLNIAHRGGPLLAPEETLFAFQNALDVGADVLELDLHATSDGVVVCMHDDTVDRTTDGTGPVSSFTFEELRQLDAGYQFTQDEGATFPHRGAGLVVPTFEEVLDAFPNQYFVVEIKQADPPIVTPVVESVTERNMSARVILSSMDQEVVSEIRTASPESLTGFSAVELLNFGSLTPDQEESYEPPGEFLQVPEYAVDEEFVERARRFELRVQVWTINDREDMEAIFALGVDGIMTDDPATLEEVIDQ